MTKRPSLGSRPAPRAAQVAVEPRRRKPPTPPMAPDPPAPQRPPGRVGKVQLGGYFDVTAKRQIDVFAAREGRTMQSVMEEMYNLFCEKYGLHRLADTSD